MDPETPETVRLGHRKLYPTTESQGFVSPNNSGFDPQTLARVRNLIHWLVRAPHLKQDREDYMQEAALRFWQVIRKSSGFPYHSHSRYWHSFILDILRRGKSLDSPKRRWLSHPFDLNELFRSSKPPAELISSADPSREASANDDLIQILARLSGNDKKILRLLVEGNGTREVARLLCMSPSGVGKSKLRIKSAANQIGLRAKSSRCPRARKKII